MGIQVTELTLGKDCHEKEFIDFEFDGKHISEFGMVAVADGGRHSFDAAPTFEDETSQVNGVDGQYYWGTHFGSKKMSFVLATDGMTEAEVNAFKNHFKPGKYGKFIEDKLACRCAWGRISQVTTFSMVPFRKLITVKEGADKFSFYINEYKGDCRITFEFDNPYFETVSNLIQENSIKNNIEAYRILYTNNTPHLSSWPHNEICFIGDQTYYLKQGSANELSATQINNSELFYYNPATAKTKGILELEFQPSFTSGFPVYFTNINDDVNNPSLPYNQVFFTKSITFDDIEKTNSIEDFYNEKELRYTSPDVVYSINKAIKIAYEYPIKDTNALEVEENLRLQIVNPKVMGWAASVLRIIKTKDAYYNSETGTFTNGIIQVNCQSIGIDGSPSLTWQNYFNVFMLYMLATCPQPDNYHLENIAEGWTFNPYTICFDGKQNRTYINYQYNQIIENLQNFSVTEENCGDMILSEYLNLDGGDTVYQNTTVENGITHNLGEIQTFHAMAFRQGSNTFTPSNIKLYYTPTYF